MKMKINVTFILSIDGDISQREIRDKFFEWFDYSPKLSPAEYDDDYQVWIESVEMKLTKKQGDEICG